MLLRLNKPIFLANPFLHVLIAAFCDLPFFARSSTICNLIVRSAQAALNASISYPLMRQMHARIPNSCIPVHKLYIRNYVPAKSYLGTQKTKILSLLRMNTKTLCAMRMVNFYEFMGNLQLIRYHICFDFSFDFSQNRWLSQTERKQSEKFMTQRRQERTEWVQKQFSELVCSFASWSILNWTFEKHGNYIFFVDCVSMIDTSQSIW